MYGISFSTDDQCGCSFQNILSVKPPMSFKRLQPHNNKTERKPSKFSLSCFHFIMSKANKWFLKAQMSRVFRFL